MNCIYSARGKTHNCQADTYWSVSHNSGKFTDVTLLGFCVLLLAQNKSLGHRICTMRNSQSRLTAFSLQGHPLLKNYTPSTFFASLNRRALSITACAPPDHTYSAFGRSACQSYFEVLS